MAVPSAGRGIFVHPDIGHGLSRCVPLGTLVSVAILAWLGILGAHPVGSLAPRAGVVDYARQSVEALASLLGPARLYAGRWMLLATAFLSIAVWRDDSRARGPLLLVVLGVPALVLMFSSTWVQDPLNGRFVIFAWPVLVGVLVRATTLARGQVRIAATLMLAITISVQTARVWYWWTQPGSLTYPERATWAMTIDPDYVFGPPVARGSSLLVAPPTYPWQERASKEPAR